MPRDLAFAPLPCKIIELRAEYHRLALLSSPARDRKRRMPAMSDKLGKESLVYHSHPVPGKISISSTKPCATQLDLSLAYTPGVATPCLEIQKDSDKAWSYTSKGNLVAVVTDGTAVLGLGDIGPAAGMPVMEGKGVLFKRFADIDAFPVCLSHVRDGNGGTDVSKVVETVRRLEPTFGGINLEDIAAPACFEIEASLKGELSIPVFHDDQHGTAIIALAAVTNALKLVGKRIEDAKFVVNGAGAAGIACAEMFVSAGAKRTNFVMFDSDGAISPRRPGLTLEKQRFARDAAPASLEDAMKGADVFLGLSVGGCVTRKMVKLMAPSPILFPMANPTPEIMPEEAVKAGAAVVGTGRSDFPNQINNVLGFPGIFRGALDVRASDINETMKLAASMALAELASEKIPDDVMNVLEKAYPADAERGVFDGENPLNREFIIPKPFDPRVVPRVARRVAEAAMTSGVAKNRIPDLDRYELDVAERAANLQA